VRLGKELAKDDLIFLYEINSPIEGFGYQKDPRIPELRSQRDPKADAPIVFECAASEIAWSQAEVNKNTKAYVGPLFPNIFKTLGHLEHLYTSFPEGKIRQQAVEIDDKTPKQLLDELNAKGFKVSSYAKHMVEHMGEQAGGAAQTSLAAKARSIFSKGKKEVKQTERVDTIRLAVRDLGFIQGATTDEIYKKAGEFGLELCPSEVGPHYRLQYANQPMNEYFWIAMKQISVPDGDPYVFYLDRDADGVWLYDIVARPDERWSPENEFVFRFRK
jgi:hypothetical protein